MDQHAQPKSITKEIFVALTEGLDDILTIGYNPIGVARLGGLDAYKTMRYRKGRSREAQQRARANQALKRLEQQRLIKLKKKGDEVYFKLTERGVEQVLKMTILGQTKNLPKGVYCYVSFDVPEHVADVRNALRRFLARANFTRVHLSLWATNRDVTEDVVSLVKSLKADRWIHVLVGHAKT